MPSNPRRLEKLYARHYRMMLARGRWAGLTLLLFVATGAVLSANLLQETTGMADAALASWRQNNIEVFTILLVLGAALLGFWMYARAGQRAHEKALEATAQQIELILSSTSDGFYTMDNDWRITYINRQAEKVFACDRAEIIGKEIWKFAWASSETSTYKEFQAARARNKPSSYEAFHPDIDKWLEVRAFPFDGGLSVYFRDITEQRKATAQMQQAQKMEAIGQLTSGIAHDFNNLLTVIVGNADNLLEIVDPQSAVHDGLDLIRLAGRRGAELTKRLLAFARRQSLESSSIDLEELISDIKGLLQRAVGENIDIAVSHVKDLWPVRIDPVQLESALLNLSINARDAMPRGGKLIFEMCNTTIDEDCASDGGDLQPGQYVMIAASDTGAGMSAEVLTRAFDPFFTTKEVGKGTGLGLSMIYGFVKQSAGHIKLYSEIGYGTTVKIFLPRAMTDETISALNTASSEGMPGGNENILVVEDDDLVRLYTESALKSLGYEVVAAKDSHEAMSMIEAGARPDLLFTDMVLPGGMNGKELARKLGETGIIRRVLFTSGYTENAIVHRGGLDPGDLMLNKPFGKHDMALKIREALTRTLPEG